MAHATPLPKAPGRAGTPATRTPDLPDVFSERTHAVAHWALPLVLGLIYGYWVAAVDRDGGPITGWNLLLGFVSTLAFAVAYAGLRAIAPRLPRELHAAAWASFAGIAFGFLYSQGGESVLRVTVLSLPIAAGVGLTAFYRYYTHADAGGQGNLDSKDSKDSKGQGQGHGDR